MLTGESKPRVALFADAFHEVNGVAHTCRTITALAARHCCPFFVVYGGEGTEFSTDGSVTHCQLRRGKGSFTVDLDFRYDPFFYRHARELEERLRAFAPDVIHITGPGDAGTLGLILAQKLEVPVCASWHTNLHEYAGRRLEKALSLLPGGVREGLGHATESGALRALLRFYRAADTLMAPNRELLHLLTTRCGRPGHLMSRGVDTALFDPARRRRTDRAFVIGYVGRLTVEKNVRLLPEIDTALAAAGVDGHRFLIVGDGAERGWLAEKLQDAEMPGVLRGEALAEAYANMDLFVFPSRTDTFGNVVLEALACGVPAIVTAEGGPQYIVDNGVSGLVAGSDAELIREVVELAKTPGRLAPMGQAARRQAIESGWDAVWAQMLTAWRATS